MSLWNEAAKKFEENSHYGQYFETKSISRALTQIKGNLENHSPQMLFLLGEPGSGKTFLLNHLSDEYKDDKYCLLIENPFLTPVELLRRMLAFAHVEYENVDVEAMRLLAIEAYKSTPHIIMLDEAQLASSSLLEFIRILSDSKAFWFLIAMHKKEGEDLLKSPHFYSRPHEVIHMGELKKEESLPFLKKVLDTPELWALVSNLDANLINRSWKLSNGNLRSFKKLYYNLFLLLDHADKNGDINFFKPNQQILEMAAIKAGLDISKTNLPSIAVKKPQISKKQMLNIGTFLLLALVLFFGLKYLFNSTSKDQNTTINTQENKVQKIEKKELQETKQDKIIKEIPKKEDKKVEEKKEEKTTQINQSINQNIIATPENTAIQNEVHGVKTKPAKTVEEIQTVVKQAQEVVKQEMPTQKVIKQEVQIQEESPHVLDFYPPNASFEYTEVIN